jgi:hypothetical protein
MPGVGVHQSELGGVPLIGVEFGKERMANEVDRPIVIAFNRGQIYPSGDGQAKRSLDAG